MKLALGILLAVAVVFFAAPFLRSLDPTAEESSAVVQEPSNGLAAGAEPSSPLAVISADERREEVESIAPRATYYVEVRESLYGRDSHPPIGGLAVELFLEGQPDVVLFRGTTPEDGGLPVDFGSHDISSGETISAASLRGRVVSPGYQRLIGRVTSRSTGDAKSLIRLVARPGSTVMGRVVNRRGEAAEAAVSGRRWVTSAGVRRLEQHGNHHDLGDGHFALHLPNASTDFIVADSQRGGLAVLNVQDQDPSESWPTTTLTLKNGGAVRGKVIDETGEPVVRRQLWVCRVELDDGHGGNPLPEPAASESLLHGGGMPWRSVLTNKEGAFRANGLRGGHYVVRAGGTLLTPQPVLADGKHLLLSLKRPCLVVRLLDSDGAAWSGESVRVDRDGDSLGPRIWPDRPQLRVTPSVAGPEGPYESGAVVAHTMATTNEVIYELPRGGEYWVTVYGNPFDGEPRLVSVDPDGGRQELEIRAGAPIELARLTVQLTWDGASGNRREPSFDVYLERDDTGVIAQVSESYFGRPRPPFDVPPGIYRVIAEGKPSLDTYHGVLMSPRELGRVEATVALGAGEARDLDLLLQVGGRLEVTVSGKPLPEDKIQVIADHPRWPNAAEDSYLAWMAASVTLTIERPGRRGERLYHQDTFVNWGEPHLESHWPMGEAHTSEVLPAGRYELVARAPGGRVARMAVEISAGDTIPTEISLGRPSGR